LRTPSNIALLNGAKSERRGWKLTAWAAAICYCYTSHQQYKVDCISQNRYSSLVSSILLRDGFARYRKVSGLFYARSLMVRIALSVCQTVILALALSRLDLCQKQ